MSNLEKKLLSHFRSLDAAQQQTAMDFMAFLTTRTQPSASIEVAKPADIIRPAQENIIKAVKRLRATYSMLDPSKLLNDTSTQMTRHMIHGIAAEEVIDELEKLYKQHYESYVAQSQVSEP